MSKCAFVIVITRIFGVVDATYIRFYKEKRYCDRGKIRTSNECVCLFLIARVSMINSSTHTNANTNTNPIGKKRSVWDCVKWRCLLRRLISWKQRTSRRFYCCCSFEKFAEKSRENSFSCFFHLLIKSIELHVQRAYLYIGLTHSTTYNQQMRRLTGNWQLAIWNRDLLHIIPSTQSQ